MNKFHAVSKATIFVFAFVFVFVLAAPANAQSYIDDPNQLPSPDNYKAVVKIKSFASVDGDSLIQYSSGSGIMISSDGVILTNHHVVTLEDDFDEGEYESIFQICVPDQIDQSPDCSYVARLIAKDEDQDLALLKMEPVSGLSSKTSGFTYLNLASSDTTSVNDEVIVMGYPGIGGGTITITQGTISGKETRYSQEWLKTDAVLSYGSSGGAAIDGSGKVIGLVSRAHSDLLGSLGYLINMASVYDWVDAYKGLLPQSNSFLERMKDFTRRLATLNDSNTFSTDNYSLTKPANWTFEHEHEYEVYMDVPSDYDGGYVTVRSYIYPHDVDLDQVEYAVKNDFINLGALTLINISKNENVTINGVPAKKITISFAGEATEIYYIASNNYLIEVEFDYGTDQKDEAIVDSIINSISLKNAPAYNAPTTYTNTNPQFSIKSFGNWHIRTRPSVDQPIVMFNPDLPNAQLLVNVEKDDAVTRSYNNEEYIDYINQVLSDANAIGANVDARVETRASDPAYYLNSSLDSVIFYDSSAYKISTDKEVLRDVDYSVKSGNKRITVTFRMFDPTDSAFAAGLASVQSIVKSFSLSTSPNSDTSGPAEDTSGDQQVETPAQDSTYTPPVASGSLANRLRGRILLQVEENGEAWYVRPDNARRIYLKDGDAAYALMRDMGLGITNADLEKIPVGFEDRFECIDTDGDGLCNKLEDGLGTDPLNADTDGDGFNDGDEVKSNHNPLGPGNLVYNNALISRLSGQIVLQVEQNGEAWYIHPVDGKRYYMPDGPSAYQIMRFLSLGITNSDLNTISVD